MSQLKASDLVVGLNVAYQRGTVFSLATVKEIKNRIKIENEGEERWVTPNSLHGLDKLKPDPAKATYSETLLKALPDKQGEAPKEMVSSPAANGATDTVQPAASPQPAEAESTKTVEKNSSPPTDVATDLGKSANGASPPKSDKILPKKSLRPAKPKTALVVTPPPPPTTGWSPRLIAVVTLILLMLFVGLFLYFNRAQLEHLTITPTTILIK